MLLTKPPSSFIHQNCYTPGAEDKILSLDYNTVSFYYWSQILFGFFHSILWKDLNEHFGQPNKKYGRNNQPKKTILDQRPRTSLRFCLSVCPVPHPVVLITAASE